MRLCDAERHPVHKFYINYNLYVFRGIIYIFSDFVISCIATYAKRIAKLPRAVLTRGG